MNPARRVIWIDYELVWDVWSLGFCCLRMDHPNLTNKDYPSILYKDPSCFLKPATYDLYLKHLPSVKPWYPGYQLYTCLQSLENTEVKLVDSSGFLKIENVLVQSPNVFQKDQTDIPDLFITANSDYKGEGVVHVRPRNLET